LKFELQSVTIDSSTLVTERHIQTKIKPKYGISFWLRPQRRVSASDASCRLQLMASRSPNPLQHHTSHTPPPPLYRGMIAESHMFKTTTRYIVQVPRSPRMLHKWSLARTQIKSATTIT
jgi:hypothetical protein